MSCAVESFDDRDNQTSCTDNSRALSRLTHRHLLRREFKCGNAPTTRHFQMMN